MLKKIIFGFILLSIFTTCRHTTQEEISYENLIEKTLPLTINCDDERKDSLIILNNDLYTQLLPLLKKQEGHSPIIATTLPDEWVVEYQIEKYSSKFDIWLISNTNDINHKVLITIEEQEKSYNIIAALIIAYSSAVEKKDSLESEEWSCNIEKNYTIKIKKKYEKIYSSVIDSITPTNQLIENEDIYYISPNGLITYQQPTIFDVDYMAVIQFADTSEIGIDIDDDWIWNRIHMQETLEEYNILFIETTKNFNNIPIINYYGTKIDIVNISSFLTTQSKGYIFLKKGAKPQYFRYCPAEECIKKVLPYFNIAQDSLNTAIEYNKRNNIN